MAPQRGVNGESGGSSAKCAGCDGRLRQAPWNTSSNRRAGSMPGQSGAAGGVYFGVWSQLFLPSGSSHPWKRRAVGTSRTFQYPLLRLTYVRSASRILA